MLDGGLTGYWPVDSLLVVAAALGAVTVAWRRGIRPVVQIYRWINKIFTDLYGQDAAHVPTGQKPAPGVFDRIERIEWEVRTNGHADSLRNIATAAAQQAHRANVEMTELRTVLDAHLRWSQRKAEETEQAFDDIRREIREINDPDQ